jgi:hypothetical protein
MSPFGEGSHGCLNRFPLSRRRTRRMNDIPKEHDDSWTQFVDYVEELLPDGGILHRPELAPAT